MSFDLNELLGNTNLEKVTADGAGFSELTPGYYLCEVEKAVFDKNKEGYPMAKFTLKVIADGLVEEVDEEGNTVEDEDGNPIITRAENTKDRKIFKNFVIKDQESLKRFVSDMLKFQDPENPGESILTRDLFANQETLVQTLEVVTGLTIFVKGTAGKPTEQYPNPSNFYSFVKWENAEELGLLELVQA